MRWLFGLFLVGMGLGCGSDSKPTIVMQPVSGQINYGGEPAEGIRVYLLPTSAPMVPEIPQNPSGITDKAGKFVIGTFGKEDGAAEGGYQIILLWPPAKKMDNEEEVEDRLLDWYSAAYSQLACQIKAGSNVIPTMNLPVKTTRPPPSAGIPGRN